MKRVILMVGPQYAGKSTFCARTVEIFPDIKWLSRDAVFIELFGTVYIGNVPRKYHEGMKEFWLRVSRELLKPGPGTILLDVFSASATEWNEMASKLSQMGADRIEAWHFVTPLNQCLAWIKKREPPKYPWWSLKRWRHAREQKIFLSSMNDRLRDQWACARLQFAVVHQVDPRTSNPADLLS